MDTFDTIDFLTQAVLTGIEILTFFRPSFGYPPVVPTQPPAERAEHESPQPPTLSPPATAPAEHESPQPPTLSPPATAPAEHESPQPPTLPPPATAPAEQGAPALGPTPDQPTTTSTSGLLLQAMNSTFMTDMEEFFPFSHNSDNPLISCIGLFEAGCKAEEFIAMHKEGNKQLVNSKKWGTYFYNKLRPAAAQCPLSHNTEMEACASHVRGKKEIDSISTYINEASSLILFLMVEGKLDLPEYSSLNDGSHQASLNPALASRGHVEDYLERIMGALLEFSALMRNSSRMEKFLQFCCCTLENDKYLEPLPIWQVPKRCAAYIYMLKVVWKAFIHGNLSTGIQYDAVKHMMSEDCYDKVMSGKMKDGTPMISLFRLLVSSRKYSQENAFTVVEDRSVANEKAVFVNDIRVSNTVLRLFESLWKKQSEKYLSTYWL
jgi:hypothetical protein